MTRSESNPEPIEPTGAIRRHMGSALDALIVTLISMANPIAQQPILQPVPVSARRRRRAVPAK